MVFPEYTVILNHNWMTWSAILQNIAENFASFIQNANGKWNLNHIAKVNCYNCLYWQQNIAKLCSRISEYIGNKIQNSSDIRIMCVRHVSTLNLQNMSLYFRLLKIEKGIHKWSIRWCLFFLFDCLYVHRGFHILNVSSTYYI